MPHVHFIPGKIATHKAVITAEGHGPALGNLGHVATAFAASTKRSRSYDAAVVAFRRLLVIAETAWA